MASARALARLLILLVVASAGLAPTAAGGPAPIVLFDDQRTSGSIVLVDLVQLPAGGFVVLHEPATDDQQLGPVAGASTLLGPGLHEAVPVVLYEDVTGPRTLIATLHEDANGNRALDLDAGHDHHGHDHEGQDHLYTDGERPIGDPALVEPYGEPEAGEAGVDPLLVGALTATAALLLWAVRYR